MDAIASLLTDVGQFLFPYVTRGGVSADRPFWYFAAGSLITVARDYLWFLGMGLVIFTISARKREPLKTP